ncbi:MAG: flp pilus-assembly TadE/G-like family protein [Actinomycetota bacterium]|nr:flp pilus-assembly TadE/G-like family protein [Actinomycetota bacterium]
MTSRSRRAAGYAGRRAFPIGSDRGSASVWVLALSGVVLLSGTASVLAGVAIISRHEAGTAADLAALAAASQVLSGSEKACGAAQGIAGANGAELVSCTLSGDGVVDVAVTVTVQFGSLGLGVARADARAGPAGTADHDAGRPGGPLARPDQPLGRGLPE